MIEKEVQVSCYIPAALRARARAVFLHTKNTPNDYVDTFGRFVGRALEKECERLEKIYNNAKEYPPHEKALDWPRKH